MVSSSLSELLSSAGARRFAAALRGGDMVPSEGADRLLRYHDGTSLGGA